MRAFSFAMTYVALAVLQFEHHRVAGFLQWHAVQDYKLNYQPASNDCR